MLPLIDEETELGMPFTWGAATLDLTEIDKVASNQLPTITITFHAHLKLCYNHTALLKPFFTTAEPSPANSPHFYRELLFPLQNPCLVQRWR